MTRERTSSADFPVFPRDGAPRVRACQVDDLIGKPGAPERFREQIEDCRTRAMRYWEATERRSVLVDKLRDDPDFKGEVPPVESLPLSPFPNSMADDDNRRPKAGQYLSGYYWILAVIHDRMLPERPAIIDGTGDLPVRMMLHVDLDLDMLLGFAEFSCDQLDFALKDVQDDLDLLAGNGAEAQGAAILAKPLTVKARRHRTSVKNVVAQLLVIAQNEPFSRSEHSQSKLRARCGSARDTVREALGRGKAHSPAIDTLREWTERPGMKAPKKFFLHTESALGRQMVANDDRADSFLESRPSETQDPTERLLDDEVDAHFRKIRSIAAKNGEDEKVKDLDALDADGRRSLVATCMESYADHLVSDRGIDRKQTRNRQA